MGTVPSLSQLLSLGPHIHGLNADRKDVMPHQIRAQYKNYGKYDAPVEASSRSILRLFSFHYYSTSKKECPIAAEQDRPKSRK